MATTKEQLDRELVSCFLNEDLGVDDIRAVCESACDYLGLGWLFIDANSTYKYQFSRIVECGADAPSGRRGPICLTEVLYKTVVDMYTAGPLSDVGIPEIDGDSLAILNAAVIHRGTLCGMVGFRRPKPHEWTEDERGVIEDLRKLALHFIGVSLLGSGTAAYERYLARCVDPEALSCYHVDLATGRAHTIKLAPFLRGRIAEWEDYADLLETYARNYVDPLYSERLLHDLDGGRLGRIFGERDRRVQTEAPRVLDGRASWIRFTVELLSFDPGGRPDQALMMVEDVTEGVRRTALIARDLEMDRLSYSVIAGINLDEGTYVVYVNNRKVTSATGPLDPLGDYQGVIDYVCISVIEREYVADFRARFSASSLADAFDRGETEVAIEVPCKVLGEGVWVRFEAVPVQTYTTESRRAVLYFSNVTDRKEQELRMCEMEKSLQGERERVLGQRLQLLHDPLTGAYNRVGFDEAIEALKGSGEPVGLLAIDVDHFKEVNDKFGHKAGDRALVEVVSLLESVFRSKDRVFRLGGDEFMMLLGGCKADAWDSIRRKLEVVHTGLRRRLEDVGGVTLSVGLVISGNGYADVMGPLADEALYHTKRNGRAGLTEVGLDHAVLHEWNDSRAAVDERVTRDDLGRWRYERPLDGSGAPKLFLDESARLIMGLPETMGPEDCYRAWADSIPVRHQVLIREMQDKARAVGMAECVHAFDLPSEGEVRMRTRARYIENDVTEEYVGYFALLRDTDVVLSYDDDQFLMQAMVNVCYRAYYIELDTGTYFTVKGSEDDAERNFPSMGELLRRYVDSCVDPDSREAAHAFGDLSTLADRLAGLKTVSLDFRVTTGEGWCRAFFYPVKWDEKGRLTHVLLTVMVIEDDKRLQLQREKEVRDSLRMQLRVGELLAKTKIIQTGVMDKATGRCRIWVDGLFTGEGREIDFERARAWGAANVLGADAVAFEREYDFRSIARDVEREGSCAYTYRMEMDGVARTFVHHYETLESDPTKMLVVIEDATDLVPEGIGWLTEFDVLDSLNERTAIFDHDSYDIVFVNRALRDYLGMSQAELAAKKCYEVFGDGTGPCRYCSQLMPDDGRGSFIRRTTPGHEDLSIVHGSIARLNGRLYRVEHGVSAAVMDESIGALEGLVGVEQRLIACIQELMQIDDVDEALAYLLDRIVGYYGCERACLADVTGVSKGTILMERCSEGRTPKFAPGQVFPIADFMQWESVYSPIKLRRAFTSSDTDEGQEWMRVMGLENLLILSFAYGEDRVGYISIDNVARNADDDNWIATLAFFVANELGKR